MPQYLYKSQVVRPAMLTEGPTEEESRRTAEHFAYLSGLADQGIVILAGRTQTDDYSSFGLVIFNAESDAAAQTIVANDPVIRHRVMRSEWYPYRIALWKPGNVQPPDSEE